MTDTISPQTLNSDADYFNDPKLEWLNTAFPDDPKRRLLEIEYVYLVSNYLNALSQIDIIADSNESVEYRFIADESFMRIMGRLRPLIEDCLRERGIFLEEFTMDDREDLKMDIQLAILTYIGRYDFSKPFSNFIMRTVTWLLNTRWKKSQRALKEAHLSELVELRMQDSNVNPAFIVEKRLIISDYVEHLIWQNINNPLKILSVLLYKGYDGDAIFEHLLSIYSNILSHSKTKFEKKRIQIKIEKILKYYKNYRDLIENQLNSPASKKLPDRLSSIELAKIFECTSAAIRLNLSKQSKLDTHNSNISIES